MLFIVLGYFIIGTICAIATNSYYDDMLGPVEVIASGLFWPVFAVLIFIGTIPAVVRLSKDLFERVFCNGETPDMMMHEVRKRMRRMGKNELKAVSEYSKKLLEKKK